MSANDDERSKSHYAQTWDNYVDKWFEGANAGLVKEDHEWPGDEWGNPIIWEDVYRKLFASSGVEEWQRAVEIGPGAGKYTLKVLSGSSVYIRAYDVSERYLKTCESRCAEWIKKERLSLHLLEGMHADEMLTELETCDWRRTVDAFYSIDAMVHVDLQYLMVYLITAGLTLRQGGKLILTLADVTRDPGFNYLLESIQWTYPTQGGPSGKFEWLSPDIVRSVLSRLGFEVEQLSTAQRDIFLVASLSEPRLADDLERYLRPLVRQS
jgi:hypothetical protein